MRPGETGMRSEGVYLPSLVGGTEDTTAGFIALASGAEASPLRTFCEGWRDRIRSGGGGMRKRPQSESG